MLVTYIYYQSAQDILHCFFSFLQRSWFMTHIHHWFPPLLSTGEGYIDTILLHMGVNYLHMCQFAYLWQVIIIIPITSRNGYRGVLSCDLTEVTETHILYSFSQNYTYLDYEFIWEAALCHIKILHSSTVPSYPNGDTLNRPDMVRSAPSLLLLTQNVMFIFFCLFLLLKY